MDQHCRGHDWLLNSINLNNHINTFAFFHLLTG
jgi:hypothetical protein